MILAIQLQNRYLMHLINLGYSHDRFLHHPTSPLHCQCSLLHYDLRIHLSHPTWCRHHLKQNSNRNYNGLHNEYCKKSAKAPSVSHTSELLPCKRAEIRWLNCNLLNHSKHLYLDSGGHPTCEQIILSACCKPRFSAFYQSCNHQYK